MDSVKSLHDRLRADPVVHLGRKSVHLICAYELGYELAQTRLNVPLLRPEVSESAIQQWAEHKFKWTGEMGCRQNVASFALLMSVDEQSAFDLYFQLRASASMELATIGTETETATAQLPKSELLDFITDDHFRRRPALYFGRQSLDALWALCSGYTWAEKDNGVNASAAQVFTVQFQQWVEDRYPFSRTRPWNKTLDFLALHSPDRAWNSFFDALAAFRSGLSPNSLSKTGEQMLQGITRQILATNPNANADEIALALEQTVKQICPI